MNPQETHQRDFLLSPLAVPHGGGLGRNIDDPEDLTRLRFQRDRGRIQHAKAFRRLQGKTQVFTPGGGDHYRTRLTHTLEVAGIARDLARHLKLNEDLAECIALAHDLGHPPFGHAGEDALHAWFSQHGESFEHNEQSLRIVTTLETHSSLYQGLNLNIEVLEGLMKHRTKYDTPPPIDLPRSPSLEAQLVNLADEIAYSSADPEDGIEESLFTLDDLLDITLVKEAREKTTERETSVRGALITSLMNDLFAETMRRIQSENVHTLDDIYASNVTFVEFSDEMRTKIDELSRFLEERMYRHPTVDEKNKRGQEVITALCESYLAQGKDLNWIRDYVASMTDSFATEQLAPLL